MNLFNKYMEMAKDNKFSRIQLVSQREAYLKSPNFKAKFPVVPATFFDLSTPAVGPARENNKQEKNGFIIVKGSHSNEFYTIPKDEFERAKAEWEPMNTTSSSMARRDDEEIRGKAERDRAMRDQKMIRSAEKAAEKTRV